MDRKKDSDISIRASCPPPLLCTKLENKCSSRYSMAPPIVWKFHLLHKVHRASTGRSKSTIKRKSLQGRHQSRLCRCRPWERIAGRIVVEAGLGRLDLAVVWRWLWRCLWRCSWLRSELLPSDPPWSARVETLRPASYPCLVVTRKLLQYNMVYKVTCTHVFM